MNSTIKCYFCCSLINKTNQEHIIPNAFGGKLKTTKALCEGCNKKLGQQIDSKLAEMFKFLDVLINPKKERQKQKPIKVKAYIEDTKISLSNKNNNIDITTSHHPKITKEEDGTTKIQQSAYFTNEKKQKNFYKEHLEAINKISKTQYSLEEIKNHSTVNHIKPLIIIKPLFELKTFVLGYLKILLSFCAEKEKLNNVSEDEILKPFRETNSKHLEQYASFCDLNNLHNERLCHRIYIIGDSRSQKFFGFVALYDSCPMIFMLNSIYQGEDFFEGYCYDILNRQKINEEKSFLRENLTLKLFQTCELYDQMEKCCSSSLGYPLGFFQQITALNNGDLAKE